MDKWARLSAEQRDNLVAYLDGELDEELTQQIDKVLVQSEVARHEVEALARTWELLDLLPRPQARDDFTQRTLTTLKVSEMRPRLVDQPWFAHVRKGGVVLMWIAGLAVCALLGYAATNQWVPNPHAEMLADLPLLESLDLYLEVQELEFVHQLQRQQIFSVGDPAPAGAAARRIAPASSAQAGSPGNLIQARYQQVVEMPLTRRQRIQNNWHTLQSLPPEKQQQLRALHAELEQQPPALHDLLETYDVWLQTLTPGQRDDLRQAASTAERIRLVREFKDRQDASRETQVFELNLDLQRMKPRMPPPPYLEEAELAALMDSLERTFPAPIQQGLQQRHQQAATPTDRYLEIYQYYLTTWARQITDEQVQAIIEELRDENVKRYFQSRPLEQQRLGLMMLLGKGMHAHVVRALEPHYPTQEQLRNFFVNLSGERRHELMQMRSDDLTRELIKDYFEQLKDPQIHRLREFLTRLRAIPWGWERRGGERPFFSSFGPGRPPAERGPEGERGPGGERGDRLPGPGDARGHRPRPPEPGPVPFEQPKF
jgi:anti-sigma factor RsiW